MPFGAGHLPLILILLMVTLIVVGPGKLPELGSGLGKAIREFKKHTTELHTAVVTAPVEPVATDERAAS
jgi:sec-independent protein translocase protein TatA